MKKNNPFKFGSVVSGDYFYNRSEELRRLKQTLAGGNNITLYAPRRYGKSSLVKKALAELETQGFITVYVDFMSIYSQENTIKHELGSLSTTQKALDVFIEDGLVEKMDKHYVLSDPLFKLFISQNL